MAGFSTATILLGAIAAAAVSVYLPFLVVAYGRFQVGFDMAAPRSLFDRLPGYGQRATWAHQNGFEAFGLFAAAALMAYGTGVNSTLAAGAAIAHVIARYLYSVFYILNIPILRSLMFGVGTAGTVTLMIVSIVKELS